MTKEHNFHKRDRNSSNVSLNDLINKIVSYYNSKKWAEAETNSLELTRAFPNNPFGWKALGSIYVAVGNYSASIKPLKHAIRLQSNDHESHNHLANAFIKLGYYEDAVKIYWAAIRIKSDYVDAYSNLGYCLICLGRLNQAEEACRQAIRINPTHAAAYVNLGIALSDQGFHEDAAASYREAARIAPSLAEAHNNLGKALIKLGQLNNSVKSLIKAIQISPDYAEAYANLGTALVHLGLLKEAELYYRHAANLRPQHGQYTLLSEFIFSAIPEGICEIDSIRQEFIYKITKVMNIDFELLDVFKFNLSSTFYLAYHGKDNLNIVQNYSLMLRSKSPALNYKKPLNINTSNLHKKIKIGLCSEFFSGHTIGKLYKGIIERLDRERFDVILIHASKSKNDNYSQLITSLADSSIRLVSNLSRSQNLIEKLNLDILFYPDVGMSTDTYYLAHARLAPVQCVSWGHPDTTGIDTLDYFISSSTIEPINAYEFYSEHLINLSRLPCYYELPDYNSSLMTRSDFGLPNAARLYGCPQSLFKIHPEFDRIIFDILSLDNNAYVVFLDGKEPYFREKIVKRWKGKFPLLQERVIFLPRMQTAKFMKLIDVLDVILDPIHFGSGNTMYEAMVTGTPIVTWAGNFMRGRIVAGAYNQMNIVDAPIAPTKSDYAKLAVDLANNPSRRQFIKSQILASAPNTLFNDSTAIREMETFFVASVKSASSGERLPRYWSPQT